MSEIQLLTQLFDAQKRPGAVWQRYEITEGATHGVYVRCSTNDDNDDGYPDGKITSWTETGYASVEKALKRTGYSRFGCEGCAVVVTLNGLAVVDDGR